MSYLDAVLVARARSTGKAQRSATVRHLRLVPKPMAMVLWQLGAEPFTAAAFAWGCGLKDRHMVVAGEPRDRELAFRALTEVAHAFNPWFEGGASGEPQIVVPNRGNRTLLGRLGRRLAYLPTDGARPADPELVRFGRHLVFLAGHARLPGQQLIVSLTDLLSEHWVTELSPVEAQHLPAIDAAIEPPKGRSAHEAALLAERTEIGPLPSEADDGEMDKLLGAFNEQRARDTDARRVARLLPPIATHYARLVDRGWPLVWRVLARERVLPEAPHVERRWAEDIGALERHLEWVVVKDGRYRTRNTSAQAARTLRTWEEAQQLLVAEQAIDDPLKMLPYELTHEALRGIVCEVDLDNREVAIVKEVARPLVTVRTAQPCGVAVGTELYWTEDPRGAAYEVISVEQHRAGSEVVLKHLTGATKDRPAIKRAATFSIHSTHSSPPLKLPANPPWTHTAAVADVPSLEEPGAERSWE